MNKFVLDTDICIYWLKGDQAIESRLQAIGLDKVYITFITEGELFFGAHKSAQKDKNLALIRGLMQKIKTLHTTEGIPALYGKIKADLAIKGQPLADPDLFIACLAIYNHAVLVSNNIKHFKRIPGLKLENWK